MDTLKNHQTKLAMLVPLLLLAFVFAFGFPVNARPANETHYNQMSKAPAKTHDATTTTDSLAWTTPDTTNVFATQGNPKVTAYANFSVSGATCNLTCGLYHYDESTSTYTYLGVAAVTTVTASVIEVTDGAGRYPALAFPEWDTRGATHADVRLNNISSGNVSVRPWAYGSRSGGQ